MKPVNSDNLIWTLSGQPFDFFTNPVDFEKFKEKFNIFDIAKGLSHICRWGGQVNEFYSVAQHCCLTASFCEDDDKYLGLMHDALEAYISDMQRPLKLNFKEYCSVEKNLEPVLLSTFGIYEDINKEIKSIDLYLAVAESNVLGLKHVFKDVRYAKTVAAANNFFKEQNLSYETVIKPWSIKEAKDTFIEMFFLLKPEHIEIDKKGFVKIDTSQKSTSLKM